MRQTGVGHAHSATPGNQEKAEREFACRPNSIRGIIGLLRFMETRSEAYFRRMSAVPMRLSYERVSAFTADEIVAVMAGHLGVDNSCAATIAEKHRKMSGTKASDFSARFRRENLRFIERVDRPRQAMIAGLDGVATS